MCGTGHYVREHLHQTTQGILWLIKLNSLGSYFGFVFIFHVQLQLYIYLFYSFFRVGYMSGGLQLNVL